MPWHFRGLIPFHGSCSHFGKHSLSFVSVQPCISFLFMSLGRTCTASPLWIQQRSIHSEEVGLALTIAGDSAEQSLIKAYAACFVSLRYSFLCFQHTRILDEMQFIEISGTGIAELRLFQLHSHKLSVLQGYTSGFAAFQ